LTQK
jgi:hypothetical protein